MSLRYDLSDSMLLKGLRKREAVIGSLIADLESSNQDARAERRMQKALQLEIKRLEDLRDTKENENGLR